MDGSFSQARYVRRWTASDGNRPPGVAIIDQDGGPPRWAPHPADEPFDDCDAAADAFLFAAILYEVEHGATDDASDAEAAANARAYDAAVCEPQGGGQASASVGGYTAPVALTSPVAVVAASAAVYAAQAAAPTAAPASQVSVAAPAIMSDEEWFANNRPRRARLRPWIAAEDGDELPDWATDASQVLVVVRTHEFKEPTFADYRREVFAGLEPENADAASIEDALKRERLRLFEESKWAFRPS